jgi:hypothetical protein
MTAYEYIEAKYAKSRYKVIILNALEARIFGIAYPLKKGWIQKAKTLQLTQSMLDEVAAKLPNYELNQKMKYGVKKQKKSKGKKATFAQPKVMPIYSKSNIDPNSPEFLQSYAWKILRMKVLKKYGATCMCCGDSPENGAIMNIDHIKTRKYYPELALDESNLQVLCGMCNGGKLNWDMTDWRPKEQENEFDPLQDCLDRMRLG